MVSFVASPLLAASISRRRHCATCGGAPRPRPRMTAATPASSGSEALRVGGDGEWAPDSWRRFPALQQPEYPNAVALAEVEDRLARNPPLVFPGETQRLKASLAAAGRGEAFVLQGGDCAETFEDFSSTSVEATFRLLIAQVIAMSYLSGLPIVKIGRIAGQFGKCGFSMGVSLPCMYAGGTSQRGTSSLASVLGGLRRLPCMIPADAERLAVISVFLDVG